MECSNFPIHPRLYCIKVIASQQRCFALFAYFLKLFAYCTGIISQIQGLVGEGT
jgi:hypothetical protein